MKRTLIFLLLCLFSVGAFAQSSGNKSFDIRRLTFGGNIGMQFGNYTMVDISPQIGYNFTNNFNAGAGISYTYFKDSWYPAASDVKLTEKRNYFGFNVYARYTVLNYLVLSVQPELNGMSRSIKPKELKIDENKLVPSVLVGAGLRIGPLMASVYYDVAQNAYSPYGNKIFYGLSYFFSL